jgi:hypothetical protein
MTTRLILPAGITVPFASVAMGVGSNLLTASGVRSDISVGDGRVYVAFEDGGIVCLGVNP